jgi:hypothetical protein
MKVIFLTLLLLISIKIVAQDKLTYSKVIQTDSIGKAALFTKVRSWMSEFYNSSKAVIDMEDKESGTIIGNAIFNYDFGKLSYLCYEGKVNYSIKIMVKDNRIKVELSNFIHTNKPENSRSCELGLITNAEIYTDKGLQKNYHNRVWDDIKMKSLQLSNEIFNSIDNYCKENKTVKEDNNW